MSNPKLKLAVLVYDLTATGVVRNAIRVAGHIAGLGYRTELWVVRDEGAFRSQIPANVAVRQIGGGARALPRRAGTLKAVQQLSRMILEHRPEVLLSAGNHFHLAGGLAYRWAGRPAETRYMGRASNATPQLKLAMVSRFANAIDAMKYREMHKVIAVSQELADDLHFRLGLAEERVAVIRNGVDLEKVKRLAAEPLDDPWFSPGEPPVIISAGRLAHQKNYPLLIEAFAILRKSRKARLVILGEGSARARAELTGQGRRLGIASDFRLQGFEANPMRLFAHAGLFVLTSRWEGASNVLLEAMACGCRVVAVDCPTGVKEQLDGGRIGPIVANHDPNKLARAMAERLDMDRNAYGLQSHAGGFSQEAMLAGYERLIGAPT